MNDSVGFFDTTAELRRARPSFGTLRDHPYSYAFNNPVGVIDPDGKDGFYIAKTVSGGAGGGVVYTSGYAVDTQGNVSRINVVGVGGHGGVSIFGGITIGYHDAPTNEDISGEGVEFGGSFGEGLGVGGAVTMSKNPDGTPNSTTEVTVGGSLGLPLTVTGMVTWTTVTPIINLMDLVTSTFTPPESFGRGASAGGTKITIQDCPCGPF